MTMIFQSQMVPVLRVDSVCSAVHGRKWPYWCDDFHARETIRFKQ